MIMEDQLILVDENDQEVGTGGKMAVHKNGLLHRAFSVLVFNSKGELLLQQRAKSKYHSGGLWTNTCCSHPKMGETTLQAAKRRLSEEMGLTCDLKEVFSFCYKAAFPNGLIENEYDHVLIGESDSVPVTDKEEVDDWKWIKLENLRIDLEKNPEIYTEWFKILMDKLRKYPKV